MIKKLLVFSLLALAIVLVLQFAGCKQKDEPAVVPPTVEDSATAAADTAEANIEQTTCPVMGNPINKEVFVEYKGKKVYFCCPGCEEEFNKDPDKYVKDLPQFK